MASEHDGWHHEGGEPPAWQKKLSTFSFPYAAHRKWVLSHAQYFQQVPKGLGNWHIPLCRKK